MGSIRHSLGECPISRFHELIERVGRVVDPPNLDECRLGETTYNKIVRRISDYRVVRLRPIGHSLRKSFAPRALQKKIDCEFTQPI